MDSLSRWREPVAFVIAAVVGVRATVLLVLAATSLGSRARPPLPVRFGAAAYASELAQPLLIVTLTALVLVCAYVPSRRARPVAILALSVSGLSLLGSVALEAVDLALGGGFSYRLLVRLTLPMVAVAVLVKLAAVQSRPRRSEGVGEVAAPPEPAQLSPAESSPAVEPEVREQPLWQPDEASGAAWHSASAAASGAAASGWGRPGESVGWDPNPHSDPEHRLLSQEQHQPHPTQQTPPEVSQPD